MRIVLMALLLIAAAHGAAAQDDYKVIKLEQDMRNLERQVQELSRQLGQAQRQIAQLGGRPVTRTDSAEPAAADTSTPWLNVKNWDRLREGMTELQVIELLGPPTSVRAEGNGRTLFYAMEIGSNGFLSGTVRFEERKVEDIQKPTLR